MKVPIAFEYWSWLPCRLDVSRLARRLPYAFDYWCCCHQNTRSLRWISSFARSFVDGCDWTERLPPLRPALLLADPLSCPSSCLLVCVCSCLLRGVSLCCG